MSGHTPIRMLLTTSPLAASDARQALIDMLRRDFRGDMRHRENTATGLLHVWGRLVIGKKDISIEVDFLSDPSKAGLIYPIVLLHSEAYEAAFDLLRGGVRPRGKQALIKFCLAVAASVQAEAFRLEFADDEKVKPLTTENLVKDLTSNKFNGLVAAIALSSPLLSEVKTCWLLASERNGYLMLDFI